jgi:uncharacterized membrane protein YhaH (DUF805 family)
MNTSDLLFSFQGRISRAQCWGYYVPFVVAYLCLLDAKMESTTLLLYVALVMLYPTIAVNVKRCHDRGRSGWFVLVGLIPLVNLWYLFEILFLRGTQGSNEYGADPLAGKSGVPPEAASIVGWLVPGGGHLLLGKWVRGLLLMGSIVAMFAIGVALQGKIYSTSTGEPLDMLGFVGDLGAGLLLLLARVMGWGQAPVLVAVADYGTKFIEVAGLLNVVAAVDAHSLASGRKPS